MDVQSELLSKVRSGWALASDWLLSANRYQPAFSVSYDADINLVPGVIGPAVEALPFVFKAPEGPDEEQRGFGESGIDDGRNTYVNQLLFAVWNALKTAGIEIPYPHRVVELRASQP